MFDSIFPKHWTTLQRLMWLKTNALARAVYETITGNPVSFTAKAAPLRKLSVAFSPVQSGTGDPSPDNVRPISGWDSLTAEQRGKNLAHIGNAPIDETHNGCRLEINGASGHLSGTSSVTSGTLPTGYANHYVELPAGTYTLSSTNFAESGCYLRARWDVVSGPTIVNESGAPNGYTFTLTSSRKLYITVGVYGTTAGGFKENVDFDFEIQIELGTTSSAYVPYNPSSRSISISLGSTVYSGYVDVVTGVGEVTMAEVDLGTLSWAATSQNRFFATLDDAVFSTDNTTDFLCSSYASRAVVADGNSWINQKRLFVVDSSCSTAEAFAAAVTGQTIVYPLATPITIQLTPQEVESLAGDNVLFSDANGNLTVEYRSN